MATLKIFAALAFLQVSLAWPWPFGPKCAKGDNKDDCAGLNELYHFTNGEEWCNNDGWLTDSSVCTWIGVTCDTNGRVSELDLGQDLHTCSTGRFSKHKSGNGLVGKIPDDFGHRLSELTYLDLTANYISKGPLPDSIGNLTGLTTLLLTNCGFTIIPDFIGQLKELKQLHLTGNGITNIPDSIGQLKELNQLYLSDNKLQWDKLPSSLGNLAKLEELAIARNQVPSTLPNNLPFASLKSLKILDLDDSNLHGDLPTVQPFPVSLTELRLGNGNRLTGPIPEYMGELTNIVFLDLSENKFTGPVPDGIGQLKAVQNLYLYNNQLSGKFPTAICDLYNSLPNPVGGLGVCLMNGNNFTCPLPACAENTPRGSDGKMSCILYGKDGANTPTCTQPGLL